ncbi:MAG: hypothetical protein MJY81_08740, partial [Bacteroidaceae bacterium]|nr:hypothetical protein [Bacteroidaceae bacterium]
KDEINSLQYDENITLEENKSVIDELVKLLKTNVEDARIASGLNKTNISKHNLQIYTLDGKKIDSISKSGLYIINRRKRYVILE